MKLSEFLEDSLVRTRGQVRENTTLVYNSTMRQFITMIGDVDYRSFRHEHGERFIQTCLDNGNQLATVAKIFTRTGYKVSIESTRSVRRAIKCATAALVWRSTGARLRYAWHRKSLFCSYKPLLRDE